MNDILLRLKNILTKAMTHLVELGILQDTCELVKPWLHGNLNSA